ncbi:ABC transporter permease [Roseateles saccharophilus]|uniref:ABC-2 type transport system permease protein n=1 Tax=Roseateles saccharophilus TaxID=304 RepID=A0A4R3VC74_ROSSA|nr:ABC transporter permease [Roseateles saccharophilus]MDG0831781.1 ABC transporter permease [Roseateles saccharophilus]TCV01198.1 ABC-2 type transport system permease protein [Roseateles saccharophilus]
MQALLALVRAEIKLHFSNRRAVLMSIVAPILIAAFFGSLFGGSSRTAGIPVGVVDLDGSPLSQRVVQALQAESSLKTTAGGEAEQAGLLAQVRSGKLRAVAILPRGLGAQAGRALFGAGDKPEIALHYDPSQASALAIVRGLLAQTLMQEVSRATFSANSPVLADLKQRIEQDRGLDPERRAELARMFDSIGAVQRREAALPGAASAPQAGGLSLPYATREIEAVQTGANAAPVAYNGYAHSFAGMGVQFILMAGIDMALGLLLMRRLGLWKRLRAAPLSRTQLLGSRIVASTLISLIVFVVIYAVAIAAFGVRVLGSPAGLALVLLCFSLLTASFGLLVAALGRTPEATRGLAILATLLMVMLGGAWVPAFIFPEWLQTVSFAVPTRWAVDALDAMTWRGQPFSAALLPCAVMLGFSAVFAVLAVWLFRWEE